MQSRRPLSAHERRRIAVAAVVDPRTVDRYLRGLPVASTCGARIQEALRRLGLDTPEAPDAV
jgi:hypothetical protein